MLQARHGSCFSFLSPRNILQDEINRALSLRRKRFDLETEPGKAEAAWPCPPALHGKQLVVEVGTISARKSGTKPKKGLR